MSLIIFKKSGLYNSRYEIKGEAMVLSMFQGHRCMLTWSLMLQN